MKNNIRLMLLSLAMALSVAAASPHPAPSTLYVYQDKGSTVNHYVPSGWMGDYGDLKIDDSSREEPQDGRTAIKWTYNAKGAQGARWAGVYWQTPPNNWGERPGGLNLTGYKRLTFWARGAKGGETLTEVKVGGITGQFGDTDSSSIGPVRLTKEWKKYTIDLADKDLTRIPGGFCWVTSAEESPDGISFYLDEVRFEK